MRDRLMGFPALAQSLARSDLPNCLAFPLGTPRRLRDEMDAMRSEPDDAQTAKPGPKPASEGWVEWAGGRESPVPTGAKAQVRLRCGAIRPALKILTWDRGLTYVGPAYEVVAYRLL